MTVIKTDRPAPAGTQAIIRALRLLKSINANPRPMGLDELATMQELSKSTTHRIMFALVSEGMVHQDPGTRKFSAGAESYAAGLRSIKKLDVRTMARPILEKLSELTGETATLEIKIDGNMLILDEIQGENLVGARAEIGTRWPLYATSSGKALLAQMTDRELNRYVSEPRKQLTEKTLTSEADLRADVSAGKKRGFWVSEEELQDAFCAVSTTISRPDGVVLGTVSLGGPANRLNRNRLFAFGRMLIEEVDKL